MSSGEDIADIPPPIMSSGEDTTGGSPPIISAGEATPGMPPPVDSSGDNTDNSVNFSGGLLDLLYERYGFLNPGSNGADAYEGTIDWRSTRAVLGLAADSQWVQELLAHDNNIHNRIRQAISRFVEDLLRTTEKIPAALWDIHPDSQEPLERNSCFKIRKRDLHFEGSTSPVSAYLVSAADSSSSVIVMLHDAATVLECYRRCSTIMEMINFLSTNGRPFRTLVPQNLVKQPKPQRILPVPTLGVFPSNYSPALRDYRYYEQRRRDFCELPRVRAGVLKGGIIWRLIWDSIGAPAEELVSDGPSEQVFTHGTSLQDPDSSDVLCDDELTEGEMNFICGVYTVFTGMLCILR